MISVSYKCKMLKDKARLGGFENSQSKIVLKNRVGFKTGMQLFQYHKWKNLTYESRNSWSQLFLKKEKDLEVEKNLITLQRMDWRCSPKLLGPFVENPADSYANWISYWHNYWVFQPKHFPLFPPTTFVYLHQNVYSMLDMEINMLEPWYHRVMW